MMPETRHRLKEWGNWARGGLPSMATMYSQMNGYGATNDGEMPKHIAEVDRIVCMAPLEYKSVLVRVYTMGGSFRNKALTLGISRNVLKNRLESAEWYVNSILDGVTEYA